MDVMPQLDWDETDFMECLEVIPTVEDYEVKHVYEVNKDGLSLLVCVWQLESVVGLSLRQHDGDELLTEFALFVRGAVRYVNDKRGEYLEFSDVVVAPNRFSFSGSAFDKTRLSHGLVIHLQAKPHIQIRYV